MRSGVGGGEIVENSYYTSLLSLIYIYIYIYIYICIWSILEPLVYVLADDGELGIFVI